MGFNLTRLLISFKDLLQKINPRVLPLESLPLGEEIIGATVSFKADFRTKGVPGLDQYIDEGFHLAGDIERDPQIYTALQGYKVILHIDPFWITTTTGFVNFRAGRGKFAGICTIKDVDTEQRQVLATPLVIGTPVTAWDLFASDPTSLPRRYGE